MHGVILWKRGAGWKRNNFGRFELSEASQLYTWQVCPLSYFSQIVSKCTFFILIESTHQVSSKYETLFRDELTMIMVKLMVCWLVVELALGEHGTLHNIM